MSETNENKEPVAVGSDSNGGLGALLATVEARYRDLLNRLGVNGHDGAVSEIDALRKAAGLDA